MAETFFEVDPLYRDDEKSVALVVLKGRGNKVVNHKSDMWYEIVSGEGVFIVDRGGLSTMHCVKSGDQFAVGCGVPYQDIGDLVMLASSYPPIDEASVEIVEDTVQ